MTALSVIENFYWAIAGGKSRAIENAARQMLGNSEIRAIMEKADFLLNASDPEIARLRRVLAGLLLFATGNGESREGNPYTKEAVRNAYAVLFPPVPNITNAPHVPNDNDPTILQLRNVATS